MSISNSLNWSILSWNMKTRGLWWTNWTWRCSFLAWVVILQPSSLLYQCFSVLCVLSYHVNFFSRRGKGVQRRSEVTIFSTKGFSWLHPFKKIGVANFDQFILPDLALVWNHEFNLQYCLLNLPFHMAILKKCQKLAAETGDALPEQPGTTKDVRQLFLGRFCFWNENFHKLFLNLVKDYVMFLL